MSFKAKNEAPSQSTQGYAQSKCDSRVSFYKKSDLYNSEKRGSSARARAYDLILSNNQRLRLLIDDALTVTQSRIKLSLANPMNQDLDLGNFDVVLSLNNEKNTVKVKDVRMKPGEMKVVESTLDLTQQTFDKFNLDVKLKNSDCLAQIPEAIPVSRENNQTGFISSVINNSESRSIDLGPGYNFMGFSDFHLTSNLIDQNAGVYTYDGVKKGWVRANVMQPGLGYLVINNESKKRTVIFDSPYWAPMSDQTRVVKTGWNLLHNNYGRDVDLDEFKVSFTSEENRSAFYDLRQYSIDELMHAKLASSDLYNSENLQPIKNKIEDGSVFWVYIFDSPSKIDLKPIGLDFKLEGVADTYKPNDFINFNFKVINLDNKTHEVIGSGINDPCTYGIKITAANGREIYNDDNDKICPNWPATITLQPNQKIDYNYSWRVPEDLKGKFRVEAYFDAFRGVFGQPLKKESTINIE